MKSRTHGEFRERGESVFQALRVRWAKKEGDWIVFVGAGAERAREGCMWGGLSGSTPQTYHTNNFCMC